MLLIFLFVFAHVQDNTLTIRFIGNEAFEISDGRTTLLTDYPYRSGAFGYMTYDDKSVQPKGNVILLITHGHADHFDGSLLPDSSWRVIAPQSVTRSLSSKQVIALDSVITFGGINIYPIRTKHGDIEHYSYRVEWGRRSLYFSGDTDVVQEFMEQKNLDYAFVSPWLYQKAIASGVIPARQAVIYHHQDKEQIPDCSSCWIPKQNETLRTSTN
ncbi:MAG: MBL fold metallo-hydrolase [Ignavibacteriae bacterium]|nr:MBL fold metallo-hydrolase [Ignavibacteriota bacterium]